MCHRGRYPALNSPVVNFGHYLTAPTILSNKFTKSNEADFLDEPMISKYFTSGEWQGIVRGAKNFLTLGQGGQEFFMPGQEGLLLKKNLFLKSA